MQRDSPDITYQFILNEVLRTNQLQPECTPEVQAWQTQQYLLLQVDFLVQACGFRCWWDLLKQNWSQWEPIKGLIQPQNYKQTLEQAQLESMLKKALKKLSAPLFLIWTSIPLPIVFIADVWEANITYFRSTNNCMIQFGFNKIRFFP